MIRNSDEMYGSLDDLQTALLPPAEMATEGVLEQTHGDNDDNGNHDDVVPRTTTTKKRWYHNSHQVTAMISNFSTSYNVVNISLVLPILKELHSAEATTDEDTALVASSLLAGMVVGQLLGGALGDTWLGRMGALRLVMGLQIVASVASAVVGIPGHTKAAAASAESIFVWLAAWRFVLGIGCGGVYPLAAVMSAEEGDREGDEPGPLTTTNGQAQTTDNDKDNSSSVQRVVLTFSMQGVGFVTVPLVAVLLFSCSSNLDLVWRTMLGVGALPGVLLMCLQCLQYRRRDPRILVPHDDDTDAETNMDQAPTATLSTPTDTEPPRIAEDDIPGTVVHSRGGGWLQTLFHEPGLGRKVLGTAGTWFLFDVVFYGNTIFQPIVVAAAFGPKSGHDGIDLLRKTAVDSLILTSIALPGYAMAGLVMGKQTCCVRQTPRYVMLQGFAAMTILYATIGFNWEYLRGDPTMLVFLYGMTFFFANYGPNTTTFILPSLIFDEDHRATWNGVSAAAGKLGALTGATLFAPAADALGDHVVMLICAGVALFAYLLTFCAIPKQQQQQQPQTPAGDSATTNPPDPSTQEPPPHDAMGELA